MVKLEANLDLVFSYSRKDRKIDDFRKITITCGLIEHAEGSAQVELGKTKVIAGIKLSVKEPYLDASEEVILMVGVTQAEIIRHMSFEPTRSSFADVEVARLVDRGLREGGAIDVKKLVIKPKELVWCINIDVVVVNNDGNLIDACSLAAMAALQDAKMLKVDTETNRVVLGEKTKELLPLMKIITTTTFQKIKKTIVLDPAIEEESPKNCKFTISLCDDNNICSMQKGGSSTMTEDDFEEMYKIAVKKRKELLKILKN